MQTIEARFELGEADLVALAKHQMEHSPAILRRYRRQRWGLLAVFGLLALLSFFVLHKPAVGLYAGVLAIFCFGLYPFYYRWVVGRTLRQIVGARLNPAAFAPRTLRLTAAGLEQTAAGKLTMIAWPRIGPIAVTAGHAFIAVDGVYGLAIPRARVDEKLFQDMVAALRGDEAKEAEGQGAAPPGAAGT